MVETPANAPTDNSPIATKSHRLHTSMRNLYQCLKKAKVTSLPLSRNVSSPRSSITSGFIHSRILLLDCGKKNCPTIRKTNGSPAATKRAHFAQKLTKRAPMSAAVPIVKILRVLTRFDSGQGKRGQYVLPLITLYLRGKGTVRRPQRQHMSLSAGKEHQQGNVSELQSSRHSQSWVFSARPLRSLR